MTVLRLINPAFRAGLLIAGASAIVGPLFVGAGPAAIVTGMIVGILAVAPRSRAPSSAAAARCRWAPRRSTTAGWHSACSWPR